MARPDLVWRINRRPRFSVLEMGEYMAADDRPRETIVRNMKYERLGGSLSYRRVSQSVAAFLASPTRDRKILEACREAISFDAQNASSNQARLNAGHELAALSVFERALNSLDLRGVNFERVNRFAYLEIEGVRVSVRPTARIRIKRQRGCDLVGAVVIDFAKGSEIKTELAMARIVTALEHTSMLIHQSVSDNCSPEDRASTENCYVFHVFRQQTVRCPESYKRQLGNVEAVCRTIAGQWASIPPPPGFDESKAQYRN